MLGILESCKHLDKLNVKKCEGHVEYEVHFVQEFDIPLSNF